MDDHAQECLKPGCLSRDGFLGDDPRPVAAILAADAAALRQLGVDPAAAATLLETIFRQAEAAQERTLTLYHGAVKARVTEGMGRIPCPFGCGDSEPKGILEISLGDGTELRVSPLGIHLLHAHGFLEGHGSPYRLAPEALGRLLAVAR